MPCTKVQPLTLFYIILTEEKVPLLFDFSWKKVPLSQTYFIRTLYSLHPFFYTLGMKLMNITTGDHQAFSRRYVNQNSGFCFFSIPLSCYTCTVYVSGRFPHPSFQYTMYLNLWNPCLFKIPEGWKRDVYPFWAEPPHRGHYTCRQLSAGMNL